MKLSSYKPIVLLDVIGKTFKRILAYRLTQFLIGGNKILNHQFDFRPSRSTSDLILWLHAYVSRTVSSSCSVITSPSSTLNLPLVVGLVQMPFPETSEYRRHHPIYQTYKQFSLPLVTRSPLETITFQGFQTPIRSPQGIVFFPINFLRHYRIFSNPNTLKL